mmetsp:Transcript_16631/g.36164  ORF Transcript_16631/g.36164 Transcript_16631/m.36164 type:complete len:286 (-) Transcript_16631:532-1389(-)
MRERAMSTPASTTFPSLLMRHPRKHPKPTPLIHIKLLSSPTRLLMHPHPYILNITTITAAVVSNAIAEIAHVVCVLLEEDILPASIATRITIQRFDFVEQLRLARVVKRNARNNRSTRRNTRSGPREKLIPIHCVHSLVLHSFQHHHHRRCRLLTATNTKNSACVAQVPTQIKSTARDDDHVRISVFHVAPLNLFRFLRLFTENIHTARVFHHLWHPMPSAKHRLQPFHHRNANILRPLQHQLLQRFQSHQHLIPHAIDLTRVNAARIPDRRNAVCNLLTIAWLY